VQSLEAHVRIKNNVPRQKHKPVFLERETLFVPAFPPVGSYYYNITIVTSNSL
jgi:hypothetical protein